MEIKATITTETYNRESALIKYDGNKLCFFTKPFWIRFVFGIIGEALSSWKERFTIIIPDVISLKISETRLGKPVYELSLTNGSTCKIVFNYYNDMTTALKRDLKDRLVNENE